MFRFLSILLMMVFLTQPVAAALPGDLFTGTGAPLEQSGPKAESGTFLSAGVHILKHCCKKKLMRHQGSSHCSVDCQMYVGTEESFSRSGSQILHMLFDRSASADDRSALFRPPIA